MRIFITGGTGVLGSDLIPKLLSKNHEISVLTRQSKLKKDWVDKVTIIQGDPTIKGEWMDSLEDQDVIINLAGQSIISKRWSKKQKLKLYDSRIQSSRNIVETIVDRKLTPKVVISPSGADYYPPHKDKVYEETDTPQDSFLGNLTKDWEAEFTPLHDVGVRTVIFRFGVGFSRTGKLTERMFLPHKLFVGGWIGSGKQWLPILHIDDFSGVMIWAMENESMDGTYNAAIDDDQTMKNLAKIGGKIMGRWTWTFVPGFVLKLVLGTRAQLLLNGRKMSPKKLLDTGYKFKFATAQAVLLDVLGKK